MLAAVARAADDGSTSRRRRSSVLARRATSSTVLEPYYRSDPPKPIRYIANTTIAFDHIGGNAKVAAAGKTFTGGNVTGEIGAIDEGAAILAHENLLNRMGQVKLPSKALPTDTYFGNQMKLSHFFNGEGSCCFTLLPPRPTATAS